MTKIALVTGANKGIGLETARQLGSQGIVVWLGARDLEKGTAAAETLRAEGIDAHSVQLDVTDGASVESAAGQIAARHGKLDILVNNAGVFLDWGVSPTELSEKLLRDTFETNFFGVFRVTQAMLPLLRKAGNARVVNLSSILGSIAIAADPKSETAGTKGLAYQTSKAALNMLTVALANELRGTGIKVNSAHPGWVKTDMGGAGATMELPDGAKTSVWLATIDEDGPTGGYFHRQRPLRW